MVFSHTSGLSGCLSKFENSGQEWFALSHLWQRKDFWNNDDGSGATIKDTLLTFRTIFKVHRVND